MTWLIKDLFYALVTPIKKGYGSVRMTQKIEISKKKKRVTKW